MTAAQIAAQLGVNEVKINYYLSEMIYKKEKQDANLKGSYWDTYGQDGFLEKINTDGVTLPENVKFVDDRKTNFENSYTDDKTLVDKPEGYYRAIEISQLMIDGLKNNKKEG